MYLNRFVLRATRFIVVISLALAMIGLVAGTSPAKAEPGNRATPSGSMSGVVTDSTGAKLADVAIAVKYLSASGNGTRVWKEISYPGGRAPVTDVNGQWRLSTVPVGTYRVQYLGSGYAMQFYPNALDIENGSDVAVTDGAAVTLNTVLQRLGRLSGTVSDDAGRPGGVTEVTVNVRYLVVREDSTREWRIRETLVTDELGKWSVDTVPGTYRIEFVASGFPTQYFEEDRTPTYSIEDASDVTLRSGGVAGRLDVSLRGKAGLVQGVVSSPGGAPVVDYDGYVTAYQESTFYSGGVLSTHWAEVATSYLGSDGQYRLALPVGSYRLAYRDDRSAPLFYPSAAGMDAATTLTVAEQDHVRADFTLPRTGKVRGITTLYGKHAPNVEVSALVRYVGDVVDGLPQYRTEWISPGAAASAIDGSYDVSLRPGAYFLYYELWSSGRWFEKYYQNAEELASAQQIAVSSGDVLDVLDVELAPIGVAGDTVTALVRPTISGTAKPGEQLTADPGIWVPNGANLRIEWLRGSTVVAGPVSTGAKDALKYTVSNDDVGQQVSVRVTGTFEGLGLGVATSGPVAAIPACDLLCGLIGGAKYASSPVNSAIPQISGSPAVGSTLTAEPGTWAPAADYVYQWLADGQIIYGANSKTFSPRVREAGHRISVRVYATAAGLTGTATSAATESVARAAIANATPPVVSGTAVVGSTVSTTAGAWHPADPMVSYQWYAGEQAVPGATRPTYTIVAGDAGKSIWVMVTASRTGYLDGSASSALVGPVPAVAPPFANTAAPRIVGTPRIGRTLTATTATWNSTPDRVSLQWYADGTPIPGATNSTFAPDIASLGSKLTVRATAIKGTSQVSADSTATDTVGKAVAKLTAKVKRTSKRRVVAVVRVSAAGITSPGGTVRVRIGSKVKRAKVVDGIARVVIKKASSSARSVSVTYGGEARIEPKAKRVSIR